VNCAPGTVAVEVGFKTSLCVSKTLSYDQCNAGFLCNKGIATLCTATEYQNRVKSGIATAAWIAGCVRSGVTPFAPKNGVCSPCTSFTAASEVVEWLCSSGGLGVTSTYSQVGLVANATCLRVGVNLSITEGFWRASQAGNKLQAAICCK